PSRTYSSSTGELTPVPSVAYRMASCEGEASEIASIVPKLQSFLLYRHLWPSTTPIFGKLGIPQARPKPSLSLISSKEAPVNI
ncbi:hypothetical protein PanWU01x14_301220, partial [Parasponia andersonii]